MDRGTFSLTYVLSFYILLFFATAAIYAKASENVRSGASVEGFNRSSFNFFISFNIILAFLGVLFLLILVYTTFSGISTRNTGIILVVILILFLTGTLANSIYLGKINRYLTRYPGLKEYLRVKALPVNKEVVDTFWYLNIITTAVVIIQIFLFFIAFTVRKGKISNFPSG